MGSGVKGFNGFVGHGHVQNHVILHIEHGGGGTAGGSGLLPGSDK